MRIARVRLWIVWALLGLLPGCGGLPAEIGEARTAGWRMEFVQADALRLLTLASGDRAAGDMLTIYIEGDGRAWLSRTRPSDDPTPRQATALGLALRQEGGARAYLGRPCQFGALDPAGRSAHGACTPQLWTMERFDEPAIAALDSAVSTLKRRAGASRLRLVGYSGGGTVAALIAARRKDVAALVTVAAVLDVDAWTDWHGITPLSDSLNPSDVAHRLGSIRQWHLFGGADKVSPQQVSSAFLERLPANTPAESRVYPDADHRCCWYEIWRAFQREYPESW